MRRNDIVRLPEGWFYGRVIRIIKDKVNGDKAFWVDCGLNFNLTPVSKLEMDGYKGRIDSDSERFVPMTSLRKLKQRASKYHGKDAWNTPLDYEYMRVYEDEL